MKGVTREDMLVYQTIQKEKNNGLSLYLIVTLLATQSACTLVAS